MGLYSTVYDAYKVRLAWYYFGFEYRESCISALKKK